MDRIIIFTGSRHYSDKKTFNKVTTLLTGKHEIYVGCAKGLDAMVRRKFKHKRFKAEWTRYGLQAGPIRNMKMIDAAIKKVGKHNVILIAFPGNVGTRGCINIARSAGVTVIRVEQHKRQGT